MTAACTIYVRLKLLYMSRLRIFNVRVLHACKSIIGASIFHDFVRYCITFALVAPSWPSLVDFPANVVIVQLLLCCDVAVIVQLLLWCDVAVIVQLLLWCDVTVIVQLLHAGMV